MAGWFKKEINSLDDLKGLKMRIPGLAGEVFTRAGAETVTLPGNEIFLSLQQGVVDNLFFKFVIRLINFLSHRIILNKIFHDFFCYLFKFNKNTIWKLSKIHIVFLD